MDRGGLSTAARRAANGVPNAVCEASGGISVVFALGHVYISASITDADANTVPDATVLPALGGEAFDIVIPASELPGTFTVEYHYAEGDGASSRRPE